MSSYTQAILIGLGTGIICFLMFGMDAWPAAASGLGGFMGTWASSRKRRD